MYVQAGLSLCWSHIPHCWKSHVKAHMCINIYIGLQKLQKYIFLLVVNFLSAANLNPDEDGHNVGPDLYPNLLTLIIFLKMI